MLEPFIRVEGLRKVYHKRNEGFLAISDASFEVAPGELVSLVGPSGCGKTTLLKVLAGLEGYDSGEVNIGSTTHPFDPSRDIGMVFQQALLLKWRRVLQNVLLPAEILGLPMAESRERARDLLAMVGLSGFEGKYPYELSGGMQQRAAIARALVHDPKLVLMDEPFGALDALTREKMKSRTPEDLEAKWQDNSFRDARYLGGGFPGHSRHRLHGGSGAHGRQYHDPTAGTAHARRENNRDLWRV